MKDQWPEVMTVDQAAEYLQVASLTIYRLINKKKLKAAKVGRVWRIKKDDLEALLEQEPREESNN